MKYLSTEVGKRGAIREHKDISLIRLKIQKNTCNDLILLHILRKHYTGVKIRRFCGPQFGIFRNLGPKKTAGYIRENLQNLGPQICRSPIFPEIEELRAPMQRAFIKYWQLTTHNGYNGSNWYNGTTSSAGCCRRSYSKDSEAFDCWSATLGVEVDLDLEVFDSTISVVWATATELWILESSFFCASFDRDSKMPVVTSRLTSWVASSQSMITWSNVTRKSWTPIWQ